ncbi:MAG: hypothetical protein L3J46_05385, partial [Kangiellaceae bacterium]|nr:hypothetical protein [Kangiellaceae bacterium]
PIGSRGTLKIGALASMILVDGDPFRNIKKTSKIVQIWKNGQLVERDLATSDQKTLRITPSMVTDFNQSIAETMFGRGIAASTDQLAGGKSVVTLKHSSR